MPDESDHPPQTLDYHRVLPGNRDLTMKFFVGFMMIFWFSPMLILVVGFLKAFLFG